MLNDGVFFDGSSIAGWKAINESDMILKPDTARMFMDPFTSHNTVVLFCDILDAIKKDPYERDPRGKLQHLTMDSTVVDEGMLNEGVFFDGSSIAGWKAINESDMILKPDTSRMFMDPFTSHNTVVLFCDILDAIKKTPYERDPRGIAKKQKNI